MIRGQDAEATDQAAGAAGLRGVLEGQQIGARPIRAQHGRHQVGRHRCGLHGGRQSSDRRSEPVESMRHRREHPAAASRRVERALDLVHPTAGQGQVRSHPSEGGQVEVLPSARSRSGDAVCAALTSTGRTSLVSPSPARVAVLTARGVDPTTAAGRPLPRPGPR